MSADDEHAFLYVETDIPPDMTISAWRRTRTVARPPRRRFTRALHLAR
jgi:hypothetical protein